MTVEATEEFAETAEEYVQTVAGLLAQDLGEKEACVRVVSRLSLVLQSMCHRNPPSFIAEALKTAS